MAQNIHVAMVFGARHRRALIVYSKRFACRFWRGRLSYIISSGRLHVSMAFAKIHSFPVIFVDEFAKFHSFQVIFVDESDPPEPRAFRLFRQCAGLLVVGHNKLWRRCHKNVIFRA